VCFEILIMPKLFLEVMTSILRQIMQNTFWPIFEKVAATDPKWAHPVIRSTPKFSELFLVNFHSKLTRKVRNTLVADYRFCLKLEYPAF